MEFNMIAPVNELGYGKVGCEFTYSGIEAGDKVNLFPIGNITCYKHREKNIREALANSASFRNDVPCVRIWHQHDMSMFVGKGLHIGFPIFELDNFTSNEIHHLKSCDRLFVCSQWAKSVLETFGIKDVHVVQLGYNPEVFRRNVFSKDMNSPYIFLNMGKWEKRKGHDILVEAFNKAFSKHDNVQLWMCNDNPFISKQEQESWETLYKKSELGHKISIIPRLPTDLDVANLMRKADCGIFPSRAEGWNLEASEMIACGKPVIMTNYAGQTEFIEERFAIPVRDKRLAYDGKWFFEQGSWAEPDIDATIELMRKVYKDNIRTTAHQVPTWGVCYEQFKRGISAT